MTMKKIQDGISRSLRSMETRSKTVQGYLNRVVYPLYQNAQRLRWQSENGTQGTKWLPYERTFASSGAAAAYRRHKLKKFAAAPGGGRKLMIASGRTFQSVIGPSIDHRKLVTARSIKIATVVPYARYANDARPFDEFNEEFKVRIRKGIAKYLVTGRMR